MICSPSEALKSPFMTVNQCKRFKRGSWIGCSSDLFVYVKCASPPPPHHHLPHEARGRSSGRNLWLTQSFFCDEWWGGQFPNRSAVNTGCESGSDSKWKQSSRWLLTVGSESSQLHEVDQLPSPHADHQSRSSLIPDKIFLPLVRCDVYL